MACIIQRSFHISDYLTTTTTKKPKGLVNDKHICLSVSISKKDLPREEKKSFQNLKCIKYLNACHSLSHTEQKNCCLLHKKTKQYNPFFVLHRRKDFKNKLFSFQVPPLTPSTNKKVGEVLKTTYATWEKDAERLCIPRDPRTWTPDHVGHWLSWAIREFSLQNFTQFVQQFQVKNNCFVFIITIPFVNTKKSRKFQL